MPRAIACSSCRQDKLRCDAPAVAPDPCTRCRKRDLTCEIDASFKRTPTRSRLQNLTQEVQQLRRSLNQSGNHIIETSSNEQVSATHSPLSSSHQAPLVNLNGAPYYTNQDGSAQLGDVALSNVEIRALCVEYFQRYHPLFPILDTGLQFNKVREDCPLLFWAIITTASRSLQPELFERLSNLLPTVVSGSSFFQTYSIQPCQALLVLCMWPMPIKKSREDVRWIYSGIAMQMATLAGLHKVNADHEYRKAGATPSTEKTRRELRRTWYCCCYVSATLSSEFGLPSLVPHESIHWQNLDEHILPVAFVSTVRIVLESDRINRVMDHNSSERPSASNDSNLGLLKMLEVDLDALHSSLRANKGAWDASVEFSFLVAKLNLYSFELNQATKSKTPEATQLRMSAFDCATRLVKQFAQTPFILIDQNITTALQALPSQTHYPRAYWKGLLYASLALTKLTLTNGLPEPEMSQCRDTIQQAHDVFIACSIKELDESDRAARLIDVLRQEVMFDILRPRHDVHTRMGASLMYELVYSAVLWKKQKAKQEQMEARAARNGQSESQISTDLSISPSLDRVYPQNPEEWIQSSGYPGDGMGAIGFDINFWDTAMFNELFDPGVSVVQNPGASSI